MADWMTIIDLSSYDKSFIVQSFDILSKEDIVHMQTSLHEQDILVVENGTIHLKRVCTEVQKEVQVELLGLLNKRFEEASACLADLVEDLVLNSVLLSGFSELQSLCRWVQEARELIGYLRSNSKLNPVLTWDMLQRRVKSLNDNMLKFKRLY